ncbi:lipocalin family protein [Gemmatimonadota bacterium]
MKRIPSPLAMLAVLVVANLILLIAGCASIPRTAADVAGTYNLQTIAGYPLPWLVLSGAVKREVTAGHWQLNSDMTYSFSAINRYTRQDGVVRTETRLETGTFTVSGSSLTFKETGETRSYTGSLVGKTLTIIEGGYAIVFVKP